MYTILRRIVLRKSQPMTIKPIENSHSEQYDSVVTHPLQSFEWGQFRKKTGITVIRKGCFENNIITNGFQITIHPIPHTPWTIGYLPKGTLPTPEIIEELGKIGKSYNCIFIQLEPNIEINTPESLLFEKLFKQTPHLYPSAHPLFTKNTFILDITKTEEELLKNMHPKTRYNIRVAQKHQVVIKEEGSQEAFSTYWKLMKETTTRQNFYAHTQKYHEHMWQTLHSNNTTGLKAYLLIAYYTDETEKKAIPLATWILFTFHKTLYYPYGASSNLYRNVMASNLIMWEAILFGKKLGMEQFDMWGSLGQDPDPRDPWYGFHRLKSGYGPRLAEFVGSYDLVINPFLYQAYKAADKLRWFILKFKK